jgi:hypothetical protein
VLPSVQVKTAPVTSILMTWPGLAEASWGADQHCAECDHQRDERSGPMKQTSNGHL